MTIAEIMKKAKMIKERLRNSYYETICVRGSTGSTGLYRLTFPQSCLVVKQTNNKV